MVLICRLSGFLPRELGAAQPAEGIITMTNIIVIVIIVIISNNR